MKRHSRLWPFAASFLLVPIVLALAPLVGAHSWPLVRPVSKTQTFTDPGARGKDAPFAALVRDAEGDPAYRVECHNGNYDGESAINFSGDFQCTLFAVTGNGVVSGNLLAADTKDEQSTDWWNRGRMRSAQLRGKCLAYPQYRTDRQFKVRGMLVTLRFTDVRWSFAKNGRRDPILQRFTFTLSVVPDQTAHSPTAELSSGIKPPTSCYP